MVSDSEIAERLKEILRTADLTTTTTASIRRKLQDELHLDLSHKKAFIREQVDLYLLHQQQQQQHNNNDVKEEEDNNNEVKEEEEAERSSEQEEDDQGEDEDEEEEEDEDNDKIRKKKGSIKEKKKRGAGGGFTKLCGLSPELQALLGVSELPRTQVVKQLWVYIKENNLQDPQNKRKIICDEKLRTVLKKSSIDMFEMSKVLSDHIFRLDKENEGSEDPEPKAKRQKHEKMEGGKGKGGAKGKTTGLCSPLPLSDALVTFLGTGESELSRAEVVKRIWGYVKDNNLQVQGAKIEGGNELRAGLPCALAANFMKRLAWAMAANLVKWLQISRQSCEFARKRQRILGKKSEFVPRKSQRNCLGLHFPKKAAKIWREEVLQIRLKRRVANFLPRAVVLVELRNHKAGFEKSGGCYFRGCKLPNKRLRF